MHDVVLYKEDRSAIRHGIEGRDTNQGILVLVVVVVSGLVAQYPPRLQTFQCR
jgi:hypothetical protein